MNKLIWTGRVLSWLIGALLIMSAAGKFAGGAGLEEGLKHLGLPMSMVKPLAIVELTCAVVYLIPQTAVLGAILIAGYMGGAICTHWRVGDPFIVQIGVGVVAWLGVYLRDRRLWALLPLRRLYDGDAAT
ncbi:MAG: DoxX family protein [Pirellulales bacterium]|nr:DoxX family protein [Pirellulales bacterium]